MSRPELLQVAEALGYTFADPVLLETALTHASWSHENGGPDYERLEFLGDAVLQAATTTLLLEHLPEAREGQLSRVRARLVNTVALAELGRRLVLGPALRLGIGEASTGGRDRPKVLAGATEAVLGAIFVDGGFEAARAVVEDWMETPLQALEAEAQRGWKDPRSLLQEKVQQEIGATPQYAVTACDGPPHEPTFEVEVRVGDRVLARGTGPSKREASRRAAEAALHEPVGAGG